MAGYCKNNDKLHVCAFKLFSTKRCILYVLLWHWLSHGCCDAHWMHIQSLSLAFTWMCFILMHILSRFNWIWLCMIHVWWHLPFWLVVHARTHYCNATFLYRHWERKRLVFWWLKQVVHCNKKNDHEFHCATSFDVKLQPALAGKTSEQPSSIVLVRCCRFLWLFAGRLVVCPNLLQICVPVVPCEHDWCASNVLHFECALKAHHNEHHVKAPSLYWLWISRPIYVLISFM